MNARFWTVRAGLVAGLVVLALALPLHPTTADDVVVAKADAPAAGGGDALLTLLQGRDAAIKRLVGDRTTVADDQTRARLKALINEIFDFEVMARTALADDWADLDAARQRRFTELFAELVRTNSIRNLDVYRADIRYEDIDVNADGATVATVATYDDKRARIEYHFRRADGPTDWRVVDFLLDGVSTAKSYQRSFRTIMRKYGYDGLIERIQKKIDSV